MKRTVWHIVNWEKYQARSDKEMPWFKLWSSMFDRDWWQNLGDENKIIPIIFLDVARKFNNRLPSEPCYYIRNYNLKHTSESMFNICNLLISIGFLSDVSKIGKDDIEDKIREDKIREDKSIYSPIFEELWTKYPSKDGKKSAEKHFKATVKTEQDVSDIRAALDNYLKHLESKTWKEPKNGSTWFNNWRDWVSYTEVTRETDEERDKRLLNEIRGK